MPMVGWLMDVDVDTRQPVSDVACFTWNWTTGTLTVKLDFKFGYLPLTCMSYGYVYVIISTVYLYIYIHTGCLVLLYSKERTSQAILKYMYSSAFVRYCVAIVLENHY